MFYVSFYPMQSIKYLYKAQLCDMKKCTRENDSKVKNGIKLVLFNEHAHDSYKE